MWRGVCVGGRGVRRRTRGGCTCSCAGRGGGGPVACAAACCVVVAYSALGALVFVTLEGAPPPPATPMDSAHTALRARTVERLWAITEDLNILYKDNWTSLAARELVEFQRALVETAPPPRHVTQHRWTFSGSFLYALTLITTIGHGNVIPQSAAGKVASVAYSCVGIPLVMLYLSTVGAALARGTRGLYWRLRPAPRDPPRPSSPPRTPFEAALNVRERTCREHEHERVPSVLGAALLIAYVTFGALVFGATERWSFLDGCYFSFASLATIGFGDLRPGLYARTVSARAEDIALAVCCAYILVGVVVVAMCFDLARGGRVVPDSSAPPTAS